MDRYGAFRRSDRPVVSEGRGPPTRTLVAQNSNTLYFQNAETHRHYSDRDQPIEGRPPVARACLREDEWREADLELDRIFRKAPVRGRPAAGIDREGNPMYRLIRLILIAAVLQGACCFAVLVSMAPWGWALLVLALGNKLTRKVIRLNAHGTARWARAEEIPQGNGLMIGTVLDRRSRRFSPLFDPRVKSKTACQGVLQAKHERLVKLDAVHAAVFAPTGVGKGVSCVIPHLLTCTDSMVVVDFKGENAIVTPKPVAAWARRS